MRASWSIPLVPLHHRAPQSQEGRPHEAESRDRGPNRLRVRPQPRHPQVQAAAMADDQVRAQAIQSAAVRTRSLSIWAILALVMSATLICAPIGPLFALRALAEIRANPS